MPSGSFARLATVTASTKRSPDVANNKIGAPATNLTGISCTPLDPADPGLQSELQQRLALDTPLELLQTFVDADLDIKEGDTLVVGSAEYPIRAVAEWTWKGSEYLRLLVEQLKR
jgi:hypothetical protein